MPRPRRHRDRPAQSQLLRRGSDRAHRARGGGVLFEVMLSIALFAAAAAFTLGAVRSVYHTLERSEKRQQAVDLARTRLAELEAGLITLRDLQGETAGAADSPASASRDASSFDESAPTRPRWRLEARTTRTKFTGLTLVELTVIENISPEAEAAGASAMQYTLRQLVAVREDAGEDWQEDDLTRGLPEGASQEAGDDGQPE